MSQRRGIPNSKSALLRVNTSIGEAIAVGALEHPTEGLLLLNVDTDLEGSKNNVRERDLSGRFTGNEGTSPWPTLGTKVLLPFSSARRPKVRNRDFGNSFVDCTNQGDRRGARGH